MSRIIIGFTGEAGSGKTTAAYELVDHRGFKLLRFAGPLKSMLHALGLTKEHTDGRLKEKPCALLGGATPRHAMQTLGTEWGRNSIHTDLWLNAWKELVDNLPPTTKIVCDDVRFENELKMIRDMGGAIVHISRPRPYEKNASGHVSEQFAYGNHAWDIHINNEGSLEEFKTTVHRVI